jgi:two-component system, OmpR family, response regulator
MAPTVLIVDDEAPICDNLAAYLEDDDLRVQVAHSGEEALRLVEAGLEVQVCIMDLRLPGMDGNQAALALHRIAPGIRFLIHTGSTDFTPSPALAGIGVTTAHLFSKPVADMSQLVRAVHLLCLAP